MTTAELLQSLKYRLGNTTFGLANAMFYEFLEQAQNYIIDRTNVTYRAGVALATTVGDKTFDLSNAAVINLTSGNNVRELFKVQYYGNKRLDKTNFASIRALRQVQGNGSGDPQIYHFHRPLDVPTLEIYPAAPETLAFAAAKLAVDLKEGVPGIRVAQDPLIPVYAQPAIILKAVYDIFSTFGDQRRFDLHNERNSGEFDRALNIIKNKSNQETSGEGSLSWSVVR